MVCKINNPPPGFPGFLSSKRCDAGGWSLFLVARSQ